MERGLLIAYVFTPFTEHLSTPFPIHYMYDLFSVWPCLFLYAYFLLWEARVWFQKEWEIRVNSTQKTEQGLGLIITRGGQVWNAQKPWLSSL